MIAAPHRELEAARNLHAEQHLARQQEVVELRDIVHFAGQVERSGVLQRLEDRARKVAVLLQQHRGRQVARRGVDGVAEQQELHHRDHHDHRERDAVALELDEFLDHHRIAAPPEPEPRLPVAAVIACMADAHWKLSFERVISSMNTSSSEGALGCQCNPGRSRYGAIAASSAAVSRPDTCRLAPNGATMSTPGWPVSSGASALRSSPVTV